MNRQDLRHGATVRVNWPNDDPETATVFQHRGAYGLRFQTEEGELLSEFPEINDQLLGIIEPLPTSQDEENSARGFCSVHNAYFVEGCGCLEKEMAAAANGAKS